jgi:hypothetical protein
LDIEDPAIRASFATAEGPGIDRIEMDGLAFACEARRAQIERPKRGEFGAQRCAFRRRNPT